jgi:hypothetical protein
MIGTSVLLVTSLACNQAMARAEMASALQTFDRLAAAVPSKLPDATVDENLVRPVARKELQLHASFLGMVNRALEIGEWDDAFLQNIITEARQLAEAGSKLSVLPEETLCWERAHLKYAAALRTQMSIRSKAGIGSEKAVEQAKAALEAARKSYVRALARCLTSIN